MWFQQYQQPQTQMNWPYGGSQPQVQQPPPPQNSGWGQQPQQPQSSGWYRPPGYLRQNANASASAGGLGMASRYGMQPSRPDQMGQQMAMNRGQGGQNPYAGQQAFTGGTGQYLGRDPNEPRQQHVGAGFGQGSGNMGAVNDPMANAQRARFAQPQTQDASDAMLFRR